MSFLRLFPLQAKFNFSSVATNGSAQAAILAAAFAGEVVGASVINANTAIASGVTTGSSASFVLYKNASSAGSIIATFNGSGTAIAANGSAALVTSGTSGSTNGRFAAGDSLICEMKGGAANNADNSGCAISVDFVYGRQTATTPSAATGPA